jgi:glycosyltransferase 2 family protein
VKLSLRLALSLGVAAGLLAALLAIGGVHPAELLSGIRRLSIESYAAALGLTVVVYLLRALRFRVLLPDGSRPSFLALLSITASYTMASVILPAKIGEASFVVYAGRVGGVQTSEAFACLLVARLLDFGTLALGMAIACLALASTHAYPDLPWLGALGCVLLPAALLLFAASARGDLLVRFASAASRALGFGRTKTGRRLLSASERIGESLRAAGGRGRLLEATLLSLPAWVCVFLYCAVLARGLGLPAETTLAQATFGAGLAILTTLIPVSAFANFGTLEAGWVLGFHALGVGTDLAYATGVGLHLVQIANTVLLGLLGHVGMALAAHRRQA